MEKLKYHMALMSHTLKSASGFYVYPFSPSWDAELQQLLNEGILIATSKYNAIFITTATSLKYGLLIAGTATAG
ncbi:hypothetical protein [Escherichia coli]|uniref:hypothetical protein n=1 Tax=Escherichia coli TaxID=562 RepID=UPI00203E9B94|nr:hypothetical protein [Escherichia coli]